MKVLGLPLIDIFTILAYFAVVLWIGYRAMKRIKNQEDYFLGGRRFGRFIQTFAAFGQGTSTESAVNTTTMIANNGAAGLGSSIVFGCFSMPVYWMTTMWYRRLRLLTLADFFEERYGSKSMRGFYALCQAIFFVTVAAMGFSAMTKTIEAITVKPDSALTQMQFDERALAVEQSELEAQDARLLSEAQVDRLEALKGA